MLMSHKKFFLQHFSKHSCYPFLFLSIVVIKVKGCIVNSDANIRITFDCRLITDYMALSCKRISCSFLKFN